MENWEMRYTLEEIEAEIERRYGLEVKHIDDRRYEWSGMSADYYGSNRLEVYGLPSACTIYQWDNFTRVFNRVRFYYGNKYSYRDMHVCDVLKFIGEVLERTVEWNTTI